MRMPRSCSCLGLALPVRGRRAARPRPGHPVRLRDAGPLNAITDVQGVEVGHVTLIEGDGVRTGVTAVLPRGKGEAPRDPSSPAASR